MTQLTVPDDLDKDGKISPTEAILATSKDGKAILDAPAGFDTKLKTPMVIPPWSIADIYAVIVLMPLMFFSVLIWFFFTMAVFPMCALGQLYIATCVPRPTDRFTGPVFFFLILITYPYAALLYAFNAFWWYMVMGWAIFTGLPVAVFRTVFLCQGGAIANNFRLLYPYMAFNTFSYVGVARCVLAQIDRQGLSEFLFGNPIQGGFAANVSIVPVIKYFWQTNPFIYTLNEVFINQWTYPFDTEDLPEKRVIAGAKKMVSRAVHTRVERNISDESKFCANYPWGPSMGAEPDAVIGIQFPNASKIVNFTRTIHVTDGSCRSSTYKHNGQNPTGKTGVYTVVLNLFSQHFLTGWVEVNYRHDQALEHPMWCIVPVGGHLGMMSYGFVNDLFANFVPDVIAFQVADLNMDGSFRGKA